MPKQNYEPTIQVVRDMARVLRSNAVELDKVCDNIRSTQDVSHVCEALTIITNIFLQCRLDLIVVKSCRALKEISNEQ